MASPEETRQRITITPEPHPVTVYFDDVVIASTKEALKLVEDGHAPVYYIPRDRVEMAYFAATDKRTTCPHKGEARYWTITAMGRAAEDAAWSYETPHGGVQEIAGYIAFYPTAVRIEVDEPPTKRDW
ncbi:DUF427 domain-containing protein [Jiella sonneratiae]|uniref:DUF427 domain-containing protein n=1 Tax=Jiella sonneratiae TaxID=2816856 RepID=A0ABS3J8J1_9HYPH|nr:DUF427 domain-containing protein [Jiella sonneratiae]MBO0905987.1 DUF427 domain-containing protein [Jiella sonneratiae]